jgi:hypothetical protein
MKRGLQGESWRDEEGSREMGEILGWHRRVMRDRWKTGVRASDPRRYRDIRDCKRGRGEGRERAPV